MTKKFETDSPTWDEIRRLRKPRTTDVWVVMDNDLMARIDDLDRQIDIEARADDRQHRKAKAPALRREREKLLDDASDVAVAFSLVELPRKIYRALIDAHPPTDEDKQRGANRWHEDGMAPALIAACCVSPDLTDIGRAEFVALIASGANARKIRDAAGPAVEIWDDWAASTSYQLFAAAYELQEGSSQVPLSVRSSNETRGSAPS